MKRWRLHIRSVGFSYVEALVEYPLLMNWTDELYAKYFSWKESYKINLEPIGAASAICAAWLIT